MIKFFVRLFKLKDGEIYNGLMISLGIFCIGLAVTVCLSQLGLRFIWPRQFLTASDALDGAVMAGSESIIDRGSLTLAMTEGSPGDNVEILVNGEKKCAFDEVTKNIDITNQSVIEIKNSGKNNVTVRLSEVSDNLETVLNNESVTAGGIKVLCRVIFK